MPRYSYVCSECGHRFTQHQEFTDDALTVCPQCGGPLRKLFNSVGVVFKGSGFYHNDARSSTGHSTTPSEKPSEKSTSSTTETSTTDKKTTEKQSSSSSDSSGTKKTSE